MTAAALLVVSCSSFNGSGDVTTPDPDASTGADGGPGAVIGQDGPHSISLVAPPGKQTWVRSRPNTVEFTVVRGMDATGPIKVTVGGLPKGSSAVAVTVADGLSNGKVTFQPSADTPTGDQTLTLEATLVSTSATASIPLEGFMRGAPGELDSTFATNGVISIPAKEVSTVASDGRIYVIRNDKTTERYAPGGQIDTTFGANGRGTYFTNTGIPQAVQVTATNIFALFRVLSGSGYAAQFFKSSIDGAPDTTFGVDGNGNSVYEGAGLFSALARSSTGQLAGIGVAAGCNSYCGGGVAWDTAAGTSASLSDPSPNLPARLAAGAWDSQGLLVVGEDSLGRVATGSEHYDSLRFTGGHVNLGANISLFGVDLEGSNILVSGVDTSTGAPFMAKFQPNAAGPFAGFVFSPAAVFFDPTFNTKSFLASDGTILHVGREKGAATCVATRYDATGKVDPNFGTSGIARLPVTPCQPGGVYVQPDGKIIVDGGSLGTTPAVSSIVRLWN